VLGMSVTFVMDTEKVFGGVLEMEFRLLSIILHNNISLFGRHCLTVRLDVLGQLP
jgi:hypothetical protein